MNTIVASLDALLGGDAPAPDATGALRRLADAHAHFAPVSLGVARADGKLLVSHRVSAEAAGGAWGDAMATAALQWSKETATDAPEGVLVATPARDGMTTLTVATRSPRGMRLLVVASVGAPEAGAPDSHAAFAREAALAAQVVDFFANESEIARRVLHLRNEQDVLAASHHRIVTELLEAREEQMRKEREYVAILEDEVERRSAELRQALRQAQLASEAKSSFLANMSHEIRTPMTAILGYTDLLVESQPSPEEIAEYASIIKTNGEHLLQILNDILDLSKIEANRVSVEMLLVDVRRVVEEVVQTLELRARAKDVAIEAEIADDIPETLTTDPTKLRQILVNLVGNAVKFTEAGEVRLVARRVIRENGPHLEVDVRDTGIGMTQEQVERLFQPFSQADSSTTRRFGGTGLGLCISKNLAEILGGDIVVKSTPGAGSTFRVSIHTPESGEAGAASGAVAEFS